MYDSLDKSDFCCSFSKKKKDNWVTQSICNFGFFILPKFRFVDVVLRLLGVKAVFSPRMLRIKHFFIEARG